MSARKELSRIDHNAYTNLKNVPVINYAVNNTWVKSRMLSLYYNIVTSIYCTWHLISIRSSISRMILWVNISIHTHVRDLEVEVREN